MKPGEITEDQGETVALLENPATHGGHRPTRIDTHAAMVFLAGNRAWKLKRAVWFPFLDFSDSDRRRAACEAELRLNRRTAPELYLGCRPIVRRADGKLAIDGDGAPVDWVVEMRRFDQDLLFDRMAERGALTPAQMTALADAIAEFHAAAEIRRDRGGTEAMRWIVQDNLEEMAALPGIFPAARIAVLRKRSEENLRRNTALLDGRRQAGQVRHCHGDLHLRNICLLEGRPTLFDCLEFDERLACTDTLYDLAFLLMDLDHRGRVDFANLVLNRYLQRTGDLGGLAALPLFLSCRAAIRAKIEASGAPHQKDAARAESMRAAAHDYLERAIGAMAPWRPLILGIGGESGSGKSTVAGLVAPYLGGSPGAVVIRSDVTRKRLFGLRMEDRLPEQAYGNEATARTFSQMIDDAWTVVAAGLPAIADAVYARPDERDALEAAARRAGVPFIGIWLDVPLTTRIARVDRRRADASDATADFLRATPLRETGPMKWLRVDAAGDAETVAASILALLRERGLSR